MPQVDFYVLDATDADARWRFCGRLLEKILANHVRCTLLVDEPNTAEQLDTFLWQSPPESFIPHGLDVNSDRDPVTISTANTAPVDSVCINFRQQAPHNHSEIGRLVEIVCQTPNVLTETREKYRFYRQLGYPLQSHPIKADV